MDKNEDKDINLELKKIELSNTKFIESLKIITTGIVVTLIPALLSHNIQKQQVEIEKTKNELNYLMNFASDVVKENDLVKRRNFVKYLSITAHSEDSRKRWRNYLEEIKEDADKLEKIDSNIFEAKKSIAQIDAQMRKLKAEGKDEESEEINAEKIKRNEEVEKINNFSRERTFIIEGAKLQDQDIYKILETQPLIPEAAIKLIHEFEGVELSPYPDPLTGSLPYTIGYGTSTHPDGTAVQPDEIITIDQARKYLIHDLETKFKPQLEKIPNWGKMNQNQKAALYSFAFNLGTNFYDSPNFSSITNFLNNPEKWNDKSEVEKVFSIYVNPGSNVEKGLRIRRLAEAKVFLSP